MTTQDRSPENKDDKQQTRKEHLAPKLRHAKILTSQQTQYPDKLQYTGKNLRVDYLEKPEANFEVRRISVNPNNNSSQEYSKQQKPAAEKPATAAPATAAPTQSNTRGEDLAAAGKREAAISKARAQAQLSQQLSGAQSYEEEEKVTENKRQRVLLISAIALIVVVAVVFILSRQSGQPQPGPIINNPNPTDPIEVESWSEAEYLAAKLALEEEVIFPGIFIGDVDMSGLSAVEASKALSQEAERLRAEININVRANNESFTLTADDLAYDFDTFTALEKAWSIGRTQEHFDDELDLVLRHQVISAIKEEPVRIELEGIFDEAVLEYSLQQKLADVLPVFTEARATGFDTSSLRFIVEEGTVGLEADVSEAIKDINRLLQQEDYQGEVVLRLVEKHPEMTAAMIHNNTGFVAEASTPIYGSWQQDRNYNLIVAAEKMTGDIVQPGETYSYLVSLGPITTQAGFMSGSAIVGGTYIDVVGGGLCQPSTTLFQAVVKSDLEIVERHNHGMRSSYYEYGQDAMIYGGSADFKFRNNSEYPVAIVAEARGNYLVYKIYGQPLPEGVTIGLASIKTGDLAPIETTKEVINTEIAPGESKQTLSPIVGSTWETYKVYYKNGVEFDRQYLTYSRYPSVARRIEFGPSLPPTEVPTTTLPPETTTTTTESVTTTLPSADPVG